MEAPGGLGWTLVFFFFFPLLCLCSSLSHSIIRYKLSLPETVSGTDGVCDLLLTFPEAFYLPLFSENYRTWGWYQVLLSVKTPLQLDHKKITHRRSENKLWDCWKSPWDSLTAPDVRFSSLWQRPPEIICHYRAVDVFIVFCLFLNHLAFFIC